MLKQLAPLPQTLPHAPQLFGSMSVKVHESAHCVWPGKHALRQPRPLHTWLEPHCVPQDPQWSGSLRETHAPLHSRKPVAQLQKPAVQLAPAHDVPHAPQFAGSVCVLMHTPLHDAYPVGHTHAPPLHDLPPVQTLPHAPQLFVLV